MTRWIPKDAGYLSKVPRSGLEDNDTHRCLGNDEELGPVLLKAIQCA